MPLKGIDEWDKEGGAFHDAEGLAEFAKTIRRNVQPPIELHEIDAHINDEAFSEVVLEIFDRWLAQGLITAPV